MTTEDKKELIAHRVETLIADFSLNTPDIVTRLLNSGCIDVENYDPNFNGMIVPKSIFIAILQDFAEAYSAKGTCFEKQVKKEVKNIRMFI